MADDPTYQAAHYPLMAYNFTVVLGGETIGFHEVSGLQREYQTVTYRHGFSFQEGEVITRYRVDTFAPITLRRGIARDASRLYRWLEQGDVRSMDVQMRDAAGGVVYGWRIAKALPVRIEAPTLNAASQEVSIDTLEVMAAGVYIKGPG